MLSATTGAVGGGGTITSSNGGKTLTIAGTLAQVNADLSTLTDNDSTTAADTLSVTATDGFGNSGTKSTAIGVTAANGSLGLSVPGPVTVGVSRSQSIPGVTIAESPVAPGETFSVALSDATGVLSANTSATGGGGTVTPSNGGKTLTVAGTLAQVNADLTTLTLVESATSSDTISVSASDSTGGAAGPKTISVGVNGAPTVTAPATATVSQGVATAVTGIGVAETGTTTGESFSVALSDTTGVLSATTGAVGGGGTITSSNGGKTLTIAGTLTQVNADLSTLTDNDSTTAADTLSVTATDGFGNSGTKSTAIGVTAANGSLGLSVPGPVTVGVSRSQSIPGVTIAESPVAPGETFSVALSDATGVLSANTSATGGGGTVTPSNGGKTLTVAGTLAQVNADLTTLTLVESATSSDTISVSASDSTGGAAGPKTISVGVNGAPTVTAPATATVSQGVATAVTGIGVAETGTTTGESFSVALSDTTGVLSATTGAVGGGGTITSSNGGKTLTIAGTLTQVNADLSTLTDNDSTTAADTLSVTATDGFGNSGTKSTAIGVTPADSFTGAGSTLTEDLLFNSVGLASFVDPNTATTAAALAASINWGDGTTSAGIVTGSHGLFEVIGSHDYVAPGNYTAEATIAEPGASVSGQVAATIYAGILLGDANGNGIADSGENSLFVPYLSAEQLIGHAASSDLRITMMRGALEAQLKIDQGAVDPGALSSMGSLISDATDWLLGKAPFVYSPTGGNVNLNNDGVLDSGPTSTGDDYNTTTESFTTPNVKPTMAAGITYVDTINAIPQKGDILTNGQDLVNALTAFNSGQLVTLMNGTEVGWNSSGGTITDIHQNTATGFLNVLTDQHVIAGPTHS